MTGEELRPFLTHLDKTLASVAHKLNMPRQNLDKMLNAKDIKTGLLERLSKIYNIPVSYFYDGVVDNPKINVHAEGTSAASVNGNATVKVDNELAAERIRYLEAIIIEKDERIKELKECLEILKNR